MDFQAESTYEHIGDFEHEDAAYEFWYTTVFKLDGKIYYGTDAGCSCPEPFEDFTIADFTQLDPRNLQELTRSLVAEGGPLSTESRAREFVRKLRVELTT